MSQKRPHQQDDPRGQAGGTDPRGSALPPELQRLRLPPPPEMRGGDGGSLSSWPVATTSSTGGVQGGSQTVSRSDPPPPPLPHTQETQQSRVLAPLPTRRPRPIFEPSTPEPFHTPSAAAEMSRPPPIHLPAPIAPQPRPPTSTSSGGMRGWATAAGEPGLSSSRERGREDLLPVHWSPPPPTGEGAGFQFNLSVLDPSIRRDQSPPWELSSSVGQQGYAQQQRQSQSQPPQNQYQFVPTQQQSFDEPRYATAQAIGAPFPSRSPQSFRGAEESSLGAWIVWKESGT
jgi:hypothetical protein